MWHVECLKAPTMTGQITFIFQYSLQGAPRQARAEGMLGRFRWGAQDQHALANRRGPVREARHQGEADPLTRRRPGSGAGAQRPGRCCTRCGRGLAGEPLGRRLLRWRLDTGSRALQGRRGESRAKAFRSTPVVECNPPPTPDPSPCRPKLDTCPLPRIRVVRGVQRGEGQGPSPDRTGYLRRWSMCARQFGKWQTFTKTF